MSQGLPLPAWAALLAAGPVLLAGAVAAATLAASGAGGPVAVDAVLAGTASGLLLCLLPVLAARHLGRALSGLRADALARLQDPTAPVVRPSDRPLAARAIGDLAQLAAVLEALHLRVRLGDQVAERARAEAENAASGMLELLSGLVAAEEGARGQLAAELHDTAAQSLMLARSLLAGPPTTPAELACVADHVEDAEEQVRAVMARTRPPALHDGDLAQAVAGLRVDLRARYGLVVAARWPQQPQPLPLATAVTVYRFFQEALLNVVKHADVDEAEIELVLEADAVVAVVRDAGPGFDPLAVRGERGRHVGLGLLRERARLAGGGVSVESVAGLGTTLVLRLPRPAAPAAVATPVVPAPRGAARPATPAVR